MERYYCTKQVLAEPMSRKEAESAGLVRDVTGIDEPGYKVKYSSKYISWSPKKVFEEGYESSSESSEN